MEYHTAQQNSGPSQLKTSSHQGCPPHSTPFLYDFSCTKEKKLKSHMEGNKMGWKEKNAVLTVKTHARDFPRWGN